MSAQPAIPVEGELASSRTLAAGLQRRQIRGHRLMATKLEEGLQRHAAALGFPPLWGAPGAPASARPRAESP